MARHSFKRRKGKCKARMSKDGAGCEVMFWGVANAAPLPALEVPKHCQSRLDSGLGFQGNVLTPSLLVPSSLGSGPCMSLVLIHTAEYQGKVWSHLRNFPLPYTDKVTIRHCHTVTDGKSSVTLCQKGNKKARRPSPRPSCPDTFSNNPELGIHSSYGMQDRRDKGRCPRIRSGFWGAPLAAKAQAVFHPLSRSPHLPPSPCPPPLLSPPLTPPPFPPPPLFSRPP